MQEDGAKWKRGRSRPPCIGIRFALLSGLLVFRELNLATAKMKQLTGKNEFFLSIIEERSKKATGG
jgi:hypothetical protein